MNDLISDVIDKHLAVNAPMVTLFRTEAGGVSIWPAYSDGKQIAWRFYLISGKLSIPVAVPYLPLTVLAKEIISKVDLASEKLLRVLAA